MLMIYKYKHISGGMDTAIIIGSNDAASLGVAHYFWKLWFISNDYHIYYTFIVFVINSEIGFVLNT